MTCRWYSTSAYGWAWGWASRSAAIRPAWWNGWCSGGWCSGGRRPESRAADRAASLAAAEEAETYFHRAAELTDIAPERAELVERAGEMAHQLGHADDATASFQEASRLFEEAGQTHPAARAQARLAEVEFERGFLEQGIERMQRAHAVLSADEPDAPLPIGSIAASRSHGEHVGEPARIPRIVPAEMHYIPAKSEYGP